MTKYELLSLLRTEDLFTGEGNLDRKEWLGREDVLNFFSDMDEGDSHILNELLKQVDKVWVLHKNIGDFAHSLYNRTHEHVATAVEAKTYKTCLIQQDVIYMMIEDLLLKYVDVDGLKEEKPEEERDYDYLREER